MDKIENLLEGAVLPPVKARRAIRLAAGVGQGELAAYLGVSRWSLLRWEKEGRSDPQGDTRRRYAGALDALREAGSRVIG